MPHLIPEGMTAFVVTGAGRDGTSMLGTMLDAHPQVRCAREILNPNIMREMGCPDRPPLELVRRFFHGEFHPAQNFERSEQRNTAVTGFKLLDRQARNAPVRERLAAAGVRVVHCRRRDLLAKYVSHQIAYEQWRYCIYEESRRTTETLTVDPHKLCDYQRRTLRQYARQETDFPGCRQLVVYYEDLCADPGLLNAVWELLGVPPANVCPRTVQQETRPLCEIIENWDELVAAGLAAE